MRRALPIVIASGLTALLAACATPTPPPLATPAPPPPPPPTPVEEFAWSTARGANTLIGNITYRPAAGQTWSCAGQSIALTPETSYSRGRMMTLYGTADRTVETVAAVRARSAANPGVDYAEFVRSTTCDGQDNFSFQALPDGAYFIIARVRRTQPPDPQGEGMVIMQRVEVNGGRAVRVVLPQAPARR